MLIYYIIMAILTTANLIVYVTLQHKRTNTNMTVVFYICFVSNLGYLALATASNVEVALLANKVCYLGGCFLIPHVLFATLQLCNYTIPKKLRFFLYFINVLLYATVLTTGYLPIYYKTTSLAYSNGVTYIDKEYGIVYIVFYITLFCYILSVFGFIIYIQIKRRNIPFRHMLLFSVSACSGIIAFLLGKFLPKGFETMPIMYVICEWIFLSIRDRTNMYDIESSISNSLTQQQTYGYITLDLNRKYLGSNQVGLRFFPELQNIKIDHPIHNSDIPVVSQLAVWLDELTNNELTKSFCRDDKYYNFILKSLYHNETPCGYLIEIIDNTDHEKYVQLLNTYNAQLTKSVDEKTAHIRAMHDKLLFTMGNMIENRDNNTGGHIYRTSHVVKLLVDAIQEGNEFNLPASFYNAVVKFAPLHDLGKIGIDDRILGKPGKLTPEEFEIIKTHAEKGAHIVNDILSDVEEPHITLIACNIARYHHEKWNGNGYPCQLAGEAIPFEARIMAVADVYDALVSKRCYKEKLSYQEAYNIIKDSMGSHFDPCLLPYFDKCREQLEQYYDTQEA